MMVTDIHFVLLPILIVNMIIGATLLLCTDTNLTCSQYLQVSDEIWLCPNIVTAYLYKIIASTWPTPTLASFSGPIQFFVWDLGTGYSNFCDWISSLLRLAPALIIKSCGPLFCTSAILTPNFCAHLVWILYYWTHCSSWRLRFTCNAVART